MNVPSYVEFGFSTKYNQSKHIIIMTRNEMPIEHYWKYDFLSRSTDTVVDSAYVTNLEYFLFWFRPIKMCPYRKSKENHVISLPAPLTDGRKPYTSRMRSFLYLTI